MSVTKKQKKHHKKKHFIQIIVLLVLLIPSFLLFNLFFKTRPPTGNSLQSSTADSVKVSAPIAPPRKGALLGVSLYDKNYATLLTEEKKLKLHFAIVGAYQAWGDDKNEFDADWAKNIADSQGIPFITWEPWKPVAGFDRSEMKVYQPKYELKNIVKGDFDKYVTSYAEAVRRFGRPVMIRFAHEMNGNWYSWGSVFNTPDEYVAAWRHVHNIFVQTGATNATWVWSPNEIYTDPRIPHADDILAFYPGDAYVDWVGFSAFNWANQYKHNVWKEPVEIFAKTFSVLIPLKKPIMISETASAESDQPAKKANWIRSLAGYIKANPLIKAVVWFNIADNGVNWRIDSTSLSQTAFNESFNNYFIYYYPAGENNTP